MSSQADFLSFMGSGQQPPPGDGSDNGYPNSTAMEQTPLIAPFVPPMPQPQSTRPPSSKSKRRGHGRSSSDYVLAAPPQPPSSSSAPHPFKKGILSAPLNRSFSARPPRSTVVGVMVPPPPDGNAGGRRHRHTKSDIPLALYGSGSATGPRDITKADLLKSLPAPRWGGAAPNRNALTHTRSRSRGGSDLFDDGQSVRSGGSMIKSRSGLSLSGYGAIGPDSGRDHPLLTSIGGVGLGAKRPSFAHVRTKSDASAFSVTTNLAKSALFKGVTDTGRIQLQLPKDSFRLLMDSSLETGSVYKRKLVDNEGEFFVEFHTVDDDPANSVNDKRLPPDMYVMAVDASIYRKMLDEVIASKTMPCGTFFCGHHEDISHPDITIAALIVGLVFFLLLAGTMMFS